MGKIILNRDNLHQYQVSTINKMKTNESFGAFLDLGLGKAIISLTTMVDLIKENKAKRILVIAPLRVANTVWKQEAKSWLHTRLLDIEVCTGDLANRKRVLAGNHQVTVINQDIVSWLVDGYKNNFPFDTVFIDESHNFKNPQAKRFKSLKKVRAKINRMYLLTGTLSNNSLLYLWSQIWLLDMGQRLGRTLTQYRSMYFRQTGFKGYVYEP